jgi:hypothetical protein
VISRCPSRVIRNKYGGMEERFVEGRDKDVVSQMIQMSSTRQPYALVSVRSVQRDEPMVEEWHLLGCYAVWLLYEHTFRRNLAPTTSG